MHPQLTAAVVTLFTCVCAVFQDSVDAAAVAARGVRRPLTLRTLGGWLAKLYDERVLKVTKHRVLPLTYIGMSTNAQDGEYKKDLANFRAALSEDLRVARKTVVMLDLRRTSALSTSQRWMTALWMKEVAPLFERTTFGTVFIVESALVRGVLSALLWVQPKGTPYAMVADLDSAVLWAISCMEDASVNLSSEPRELLRTELHDELSRWYREVA